MVLPLDGLRVVDFSRVLAGPHCGKHLLDLGAEVIKVEPPRGDLSRLAFPRQGTVSGYYAQQNAGKRNVSLDLNVPEAREAALALCDTADVIVENFRPGALGSFGLDYGSVAARKPDVVYVSVSGYGQHGTWSGRMAYAPTVQAEVGFTANTLRHFPPRHFSGHPDPPGEQVPALQGEHNTEVFDELGFAAWRIESLYTSGAFVEPERGSLS